MNVFFAPIMVSKRGLISHRVCGADTARAANGYGLALQVVYGWVPGAHTAVEVDPVL